MQGMLGNVVLAVYLEGIRRSCDKHLLPFVYEYFYVVANSVTSKAVFR